MRVVYIPQSSPDDPEEFGIELPVPLGLKKQFRHMEREEVERLMRSCEIALDESKRANEPKLIPCERYSGGGCL